MFACDCRPKARSACSIILRGPNDYTLDEVERSLHDALCVVRRVCESRSVVPGAGCVEGALAVYLEHFATTIVRCVHTTDSGLAPINSIELGSNTALID